MQRQHYILIALLLFASTRSATAADKVTYETHVKPILREHCFACHNQEDATASLALDSFDGLTAGGAGGEVVSAGDPDGSRLWKLVTHEEEPKMPPGDKLPQANLDILKAWINGGLLKDAGSKPLKNNKPAIAKIDADKLGKPMGEPAMPAQLLHEPVLWTATPGPVEALATSPWAPLAAIGWQRQVSFYHTDTHELLGIIPYVDGIPKVVRFSRDGSLVLIAGGRHAAAGSAALFDVKTGGRLATLGDELDIVLAADISPDLSLVAIGGPKKRVKVYRVADGEVAYQITKHTDWITSLAFSPNGKLLSTADRNGGALIWQAAAGHERADLRGHKAAVTSLDWRADSAMLATACEDGTVKLWDPRGNQIKSINTNKGGVLSVRFAQNGNFVTVGRDRHVRTWKPDGGTIADLGQMPEMTLAAAFTHDGKHVFASDYSGKVQVFDIASKKTVTTIQPNPKTLSQRLSIAEKASQHAEQEFRDLKNRKQTLLAELEQGKAAHEAHDKKLAKTQTKLAEKRKLYDEAVKLLEEHKQKLTQKRKLVTQSSTRLADATKTLEEALAQASDATKSDEAVETPEDSDTSNEKTEAIAKLEQAFSLAQADHNSVKQQLTAAEQSLADYTEQQKTALNAVQITEDLLAQVQNETASLPDIAKLTEQHEQVKSQLAISKQDSKQAQQDRTRIVAQQERFAKATAKIAEQIELRQSEQQDLAKETGRLEAEHKQSADRLLSHTQQLAKVAKQLEKLQGQLANLESTAVKMRESESTVAKQLRKIQAKLAASEQEAGLLQQRQQDLQAAEALRKKYSSKQ